MRPASLRKSSRLPPAASTARTAATLILRRRSAASRSRLAFVLELPDGATPVNSFRLSSGVKFTKSTALLVPGILPGVVENGMVVVVVLLVERGLAEEWKDGGLLLLAVVVVVVALLGLRA